MRFSTRTRYGTRTLLDLALHQDEGMVTLKDIARRQEISLGYLKHLIAPLTVSGIIRSERGSQGGISLARDPREIRLDEVIALLEGTIDPAECVHDPGVCKRAGQCAPRELWHEISTAIEGVLSSTTLFDLAERQREQEQPSAAVTYSI